MNPTLHAQGQGPRLVIGRSRTNLVRIDTSAFAELQRPAVDPGVFVPGDLPVRTFSDVTKGLGLSYEAERDLTRAMEEWMASPDPVTFRGRVTRGLRSFAPDNYAARNEIWRRCASLYRSISPPRNPRVPQSVLIQKAMKRGKLSGAQLEDIARRASSQMNEHFAAGRSGINKWKVAEFLRYNPDPTDEKVHGFAREIGMEPDDLEQIIYELATDHALDKGEQIPGGLAAGKKPDDFDTEQLAVGTHVELEHTANRAMAMEIAMDHLTEDKDYYKNLKKIEKSGDDYGWGPMPGIDGGLRRSVPGGYQYRFPPADLTAGADPALERILNAKPTPQPPELLFCYSDDDQMSKGDHADLLEQLEKAIKPDPGDDVITIRCRGDAGQTLARMLRYMQSIASAGASRSWGVMSYTPKTDPDYTSTFGIDGDGADKITEVKLNGKVIKALVESDLFKAAQHKYLKRIPTGKPRPKYRYIYKHPKRKGLVDDDHLVSGAKFKVRHAGELGHFEVLEHNEKTGVVKVQHDESGRVAHIKKRDLARMLQAHHEKEGKKEAAATPAADKATGKLQRVQMADLARGEWEKVVGFEATEDAALELAGNLKRGWDYAAIKQSGGFMVVAKRQRGGGPTPRELHGEPVKVHLRNEKPLNAVYTLMEADDVVASHNPANFNIRKDYPTGVQERPYHESEHEQGKVMRIAQEMEPVFVINNNPDGVSGSPIITQDGIVLGGNARTMGIQRAYKTEPASAKKYKNYLTAHAKDYGFNAADVRGMKAPVLVRRTKISKTNNRFQSEGQFDQVKYNAHLRLLGRRMNEGLTQGLDPRAEEVALGQNFVDSRMLRTLTDNIKEGQTLDQFLQTQDSRNFIKTLRSNGIIDDLNAGQFLYGKSAESDKGLLNKEGRARLERILVGKMIDSPTLLDRMTSTQRQALANSAVHIVVAQQSGWDIVPKLKRAIQIDQSIQKMDKQLQGEGSPRKALKNFLSGKQTELAGITGMAEEVRGDEMLHHLLMVVRERAGVDIMPRDFKGFALRAREDAQRNSALSGVQDMFGGVHAAKREDPADALDIEFGITPPRKKKKTERRKERIAEEARQKAERERIKKERAAMASGEGSLFSASMDYSFDLVKAMPPNRLVTRAVNHVEFLVDAAVSNSMLEHGEIRVDGAKITRKVLADINEAIRKDPELAREQGRSPLDAKTVRGLIEAFCQIRGKDLLEKATPAMHANVARKLKEMQRRGDRSKLTPPGKGWEPIPGGKHKGYRKMVGGKWEYWYPRGSMYKSTKEEWDLWLAQSPADMLKGMKRPPGTGWTPPSGKRKSWRKRVGGKHVYWSAQWGHHGESTKTLFGEERGPIPKPSNADRDEAKNQAEQSDPFVRADAIADRLKRHGVDKLPGKYAQAVESWSRLRPDVLRRVRNATGIEGIHAAQDEAIKFAQNMGDKMREFEERQQTMFIEQPKEPAKRELEPAKVKAKAREAYSLGVQDPAAFTQYMNAVVDQHGEAQAKLVMDQVAYLQEARRGRVTASAPAPAKRVAAGQQGLFSGHQATQRGEQGSLFRSQRLVVKAHVYR